MTLANSNSPCVYMLCTPQRFTRQQTLQYLWHLSSLNTHPQGLIPLLRELWSSSDSLVPDNGEVCDADVVLSDSNARVNVHHHMPPASRNKYDFPRALKDLNLRDTPKISKISTSIPRKRKEKKRKKRGKKTCSGESGYRSRYLSHAKRALYHLS